MELCVYLIPQKNLRCDGRASRLTTIMIGVVWWRGKVRCCKCWGCSIRQSGETSFVFLVFIICAEKIKLIFHCSFFRYQFIDYETGNEPLLQQVTAAGRSILLNKSGVNHFLSRNFYSTLWKVNLMSGITSLWWICRTSNVDGGQLLKKKACTSCSSYDVIIIIYSIGLPGPLMTLS